MAQIQPIGDKVVVQVVEAEQKTAGGILLPDAAQKKPTEGKVVAVGEGRWLENGKRNSMSVKPGDRKLAITLFTILFMFGATLTIIGSFFRGTGYNWVWPWAQGVFFEL